MNQNYDAIIIGAGIIGASIAFELAKKGYKTLNLDKLSAAGAGSTINTCAVIRTHYSTLEGTAMAYESYLRWKAWPEYLEVEDERGYAQFKETGTLILLGKGSDMSAQLGHHRTLGIPIEEWDPATLQRNRPFLDVKSYAPARRPDEEGFGQANGEELSGAIFIPSGGYINDPQLSVHNVQRAAEAKGATFRFKAEVAEIRQHAGRVIGVRLRGGEAIDAPVMVNAAGPHSFVINRMAGVDKSMNINTRALRHEVHYVPAPENYDADQHGSVTSDDDIAGYFRPETGNMLLVGSQDPECDPKEWVEDPDNFNREVTNEQWRAQVYRVAQRIPDLPIPGHARGIVDLYDVSDDWIPIYDKSDLDGFYMAVGTSGNQYKNGPMAGLMMAELIDACENGRDHDHDPVTIDCPGTGITLNAGFYSRNREVNQDSTGLAFSNYALFAQSDEDESTPILEEVMVTAQRREQNLMDVPLSVLAWDADTLRQGAIDNITLVADITPGLVASGQSGPGGTTNFYIRGIGSNAGGDPAVAYYVDEIYVGDATSFNTTFVDLDRLEVLKGPQGTLWGRNTTGGAINVVTKRPSETFGAELFAEFADHNTFKMAAAFTGPINDTVSYRFTASANQQDSFTQNDLTLQNDQTEDSVSVRGQLRFTPNDRLTIDVLAGFLKDDAKNLYLFPVTNLPDSGAEFVFNFFNIEPNPDLFHIKIDEQPISEFEGLETRLDVNYEINDKYSIRWLSGYNETDSFRRSDFDGNFLPLLNTTIDSQQDWLSSELQLQYSSDKLDFTLGAYYYDQDSDSLIIQDGDTDFFFMSSCQAPNFSLSANPAAALCPLLNLFWTLNVPDIFFGAIPGFALPSLPWFTENLLGRSPTPEDMGPNGENPLGAFGLLPNAIFGTGTEFAGGYGNLFDTGLITNQTSDSTTKSTSFYGQGNYRFSDQWSATAGLRYTKDKKTLVTEVLGTLFTSPLAPNSGKDTRDAWTPKVGLEFTPNENTLVYGSVTTGFKGSGFGALNNITGEITSFDEETVVSYEIGYKATLADGRVRIDAAAYYYDYTDMQITLQFAAGPITDNLDKVEVKGVDFAIDWAPVNNLVVGANFAYNDSEITKFTGTTVFDPTDFADGEQDIEGNPLPRAPKWSSNVYANYTILLKGGSSFILGGSMVYTDDYNHTQFGNVLMTPSYTLWNANLMWLSASGNFSLNAFGRNLSDEEYVLTSFFTDAFGVLLFPGAPMTLGVQMRVHFQ